LKISPFYYDEISTLGSARTCLSQKYVTELSLNRGLTRNG